MDTACQKSTLIHRNDNLSGKINFAVPGSVQFYEGVVGDVGAVTFMSGHFSQWVWRPRAVQLQRPEVS
jgi:hypothetical protein